jgi:hypothetical protein
MATTDEIRALQRVTNIQPNDATYPEDELADLIDEQGSVAAAAAVIWREMAAGAVTLVDTTESGSSRKLSDVAKNMLGMASALDGVDAATRGGRAYTIPVERL